MVEKFLTDDEFIVVRGKADHRGSSVATYDIPVSDSDSFEVGQKVQVEIYSNSNEEDWDLDHLKFEIELLKE